MLAAPRQKAWRKRHAASAALRAVAPGVRVARVRGRGPPHPRARCGVGGAGSAGAGTWSSASSRPLRQRHCVDGGTPRLLRGGQSMVPAAQRPKARLNLRGDAVLLSLIARPKTRGG